MIRIRIQRNEPGVETECAYLPALQPMDFSVPLYLQYKLEVDPITISYYSHNVLVHNVLTKPFDFCYFSKFNLHSNFVKSGLHLGFPESRA